MPLRRHGGTSLKLMPCSNRSSVLPRDASPLETASDRRPQSTSVENPEDSPVTWASAAEVTALTWWRGRDLNRDLRVMSALTTHRRDPLRHAE